MEQVHFEELRNWVLFIVAAITLAAFYYFGVRCARVELPVHGLGRLRFSFKDNNSVDVGIQTNETDNNESSVFRLAFKQRQVDNGVLDGDVVEGPAMPVAQWKKKKSRT